MKALDLLPEVVNTILLVDWPSADIPRALVQAGFTVYSYAPDGYKQVQMVSAKHVDRGQNPVYSAELLTIEDKLVFHPMDYAPEAVDLVAIYRPPEEHAVIFRDHVIPLAAKTIWLQPNVESAETKKMANELGLIFVQGHDIRELI